MNTILRCINGKYVEDHDLSLSSNSQAEGRENKSLTFERNVL